MELTSNKIHKSAANVYIKILEKNNIIIKYERSLLEQVKCSLFREYIKTNLMSIESEQIRILRMYTNYIYDSLLEDDDYIINDCKELIKMLKEIK